MENKEIEVGIANRVMDFLDISETVDNVKLYETLTSYRNKMHPDKFYDEESKKVANEKFVRASQLLTDLNSLINRERLSKSTYDLVALEKDYAIVNIQQNVIDLEKDIEQLNQKISKYRSLIKQLLEQNKVISSGNKEANYIELRSMYKNSGRIKAGIGAKVLFVLIYSFITGIDQVAGAIKQYLPFPQSIMNTLIFAIILISILFNIRKLFQNLVIELNSKRIETTVFKAKFSKLIDGKHNGSKISEIQIFEFIKAEFTSNDKFHSILEKILSANNDVVIEKYKNVFINNLLEKQLIKISKAKSLDREFYVFGTSWSEKMNNGSEVNTELIGDSDIDSLIEESD